MNSDHSLERWKAGFSLLRVLSSAWVLLALAGAGRAAIPPPEQLLPDDTLVLLTAPDFNELRQIRQKSPKNQLWNDPAMKPFRDKFLMRWQEEVVGPLERELNVSLESCARLLQGQLTFAVTRGDWQGREDQPLGFLLLLDARDQIGPLTTNLADLRRAWSSAGKPLQTEKIRNLEFSIFPVTTNDMPKPLSKFLWRPPVFPQVPTNPELKPPPTSPPGKDDMLLDMLRVLLTASKELVVGRVDSLLIAGNSRKGVEQVVSRLTGGAAPTLGELAAYQASHQALFRQAQFYGWVNIKAFVDTLVRKSSETKEPEVADSFAPLNPKRLINATGVGSCRTLSFSLLHTDEGSSLQLFLSVPEGGRHGIFQVLAGATGEAGPPAFVPADAVHFFRWRLDGNKTWATLEKMLNELSPQAFSAINLILDTANARARQSDPGFDLKKTLLDNLGNDFISYDRAPRGHTPAEFQSPPSIFLLGSPNSEQLAVALKRLFVIFPQGDAPIEREFLGRKIFSVPMPPVPFATVGPVRASPPRTLNCAATGGYVAMSTDAALLEENLRSGADQAKALRETAGLLEAAQRIGGMGMGLFGYDNEVDAMRATFEATKNDLGASTNGIGPSLFPGLPGITGPESNLKSLMDFSLLPAFDKVAHYFSFLVYAGSVNVEGLTLRCFAPVPPALRGSAGALPSN